MYFKDSPNQNAYVYQHPKMVSSVRPPLLPDGYYGNTPVTWKDTLLNPWILGIGGVVLVLIIIGWSIGGKKNMYHQPY